MRKIIGTLIFFSFIFTISYASAFEFSSPLENDLVIAGSTLKVSVMLGDIPPPFGVLFSAPKGILQSKLDSTAPFVWSIKIPPDYYGPLTLWAVTRRYFPISYSWSASVTVFVVRPALKVSLPPSVFF